MKNFEDILYVCDVKRKKFGNSSVPVLPYTGYEKCLDYIRNHHLSCKADEQRFITHYRKVLSKEISERQKEFDKHYNAVELGVKALMNTQNYEIVRFEHINAFVDQADVEIKVNDICSKTFFGNFVIGEVKLKQSNAIVREVWALKIPVSMICSLEEMHMSCSNRCGYIY